jgi:hypothetical protein
MRRASIVSAALVIACFAACTSAQDDVCENVGACSQAGSTEWIQRCKDEAKKLGVEAASSGCAPELDAYFTCASDGFDCQGATSVFAGCDGKRSALDACFDEREAGTSCAALKAAESSCTSVQSSTSTGAAIVRSACTLARDCGARCFLDQVSNVCAASVDELDRFSACAASCPS